MHLHKKCQLSDSWLILESQSRHLLMEETTFNNINLCYIITNYIIVN